MTENEYEHEKIVKMDSRNLGDYDYYIEIFDALLRFLKKRGHLNYFTLRIEPPTEEDFVKFKLLYLLKDDKEKK